MLSEVNVIVFVSPLLVNRVFVPNFTYTYISYYRYSLSYGCRGIGYAICRRLLLQDAENIHLCLCCRNKQNAENTKKRLLLEFSAEITIIIIDTCLISSVYKAASEIKRRFSHIDYLYLNAGIMPVSTVSSIDWKMFWKTLFSR